MADNFAVTSLWSHWLGINLSPVLSATEALCRCGFEDIFEPFIVLLAPPPTADTHTASTHTPLTPVCSLWLKAVCDFIRMNEEWELVNVAVNFYSQVSFYSCSPVSQTTIRIKGFCNLYCLSFRPSTPQPPTGDRCISDIGEKPNRFVYTVHSQHKIIKTLVKIQGSFRCQTTV